MKYDTGVYYIPKLTLFHSSVGPNADMVARYRFISKGDNIDGFYGGNSFANQIGITTHARSDALERIFELPVSGVVREHAVESLEGLSGGALADHVVAFEETVEHRAAHPLVLLLAVELDGKAVGLLLDLADEGEDGLVSLDADLLSLGGDQGAGAVAVVLHHAEDGHIHTEFPGHRLRCPGVGAPLVS